MDHVSLALALATIQGHLGESVGMTCSRLPLEVDLALVQGAVDALAREMEFGLDVLESLEGGGHVKGEACEWVRRRVDTDDAICSLASSI
jgi:hypothetical protein